MKLLVATAVLLAFATGAARADSENCRKSREYLLGTPGGDLSLTPQAYNDLFKVCIATSSMPNVKDAYMLRDGGIAVIPKQDSISATAATLRSSATLIRTACCASSRLRKSFPFAP